MIDIVLPTTDPQATQELSALLVTEMTSQEARSHESTIAYRDKQRWIQTFKPTHLVHQAESATQIREGGVYLRAIASK
jgi:hypothetical protein